MVARIPGVLVGAIAGQVAVGIVAQARPVELGRELSAWYAVLLPPAKLAGRVTTAARLLAFAVRRPFAS